MDIMDLVQAEIKLFCVRFISFKEKRTHGTAVLFLNQVI